MAVEIRRAQDDEFRLVGDLLVRAYATLADRDEAYDVVLRDVAGRSTTAEVLVATLDGIPMGTVTFVPGPGPQAEVDDPDAATIRMLGVAPEARGKGIGAALIDSCVQLARDLGRRRIVLDTRESMQAAHRLYGLAGFRRAPELDRRPPDAPDLLLLGYVLELDDRR
jgi:ribosomal protein S18 acetylase RimI-like enzyme